MSAEPAKINGHAIIEQFSSPDPSRRTSLCCARLSPNASGWCMREHGHDGEHAGIVSEYDLRNSILRNTNGMRKK